MVDKRNKGIGLNNLTVPVYRHYAKEEHGFIPLYETVDNLIVMKPGPDSPDRK